jgi:hypothetical protein
MIAAMPAIIAKLSEVGTKLIPILDKLFTAFMNMDPDTIAKIVQAIGALAVLGPILVILGSVITTIASIASLIGGLGGVIASVVGWFGTAATAIAGFIAGGILLPLLVIIGTVALVYLAFKNNFMGITTTAQQLGFLIKFYFEQFATWMITSIKTAGDFIVTKFNEVKTTIQQLRSMFDTVMNSITLAIGKVILKIVELGLKLLGLKLPKALTPGSPTPFEIGLLGIADAMDRINNTGLAGLNSPNVPSMSAAASKGLARGADLSSGGTSKNVTVNITNPKKETSEESVRKTLNKLSYLRVLE